MAQTVEFMFSKVAYKSHFWQEMVQDNYSPISISATFGLDVDIKSCPRFRASVNRFRDSELTKLRIFTHIQDMQVFETCSVCFKLQGNIDSLILFPFNRNV